MLGNCSVSELLPLALLLFVTLRQGLIKLPRLALTLTCNPQAGFDLSFFYYYYYYFLLT